MNDRKKKFIRLIRNIIGDKTQTEISEQFHVSQSAVSKWKKGDVDIEKITLPTFCKLAEAQGWSAEQLLVYLDLKSTESPPSKVAKIINEIERLTLAEKTQLLLWFLSDFQELVDEFSYLIEQQKEREE